MKQSIKIDIIYFGVDRDTQMEFRFSDCDKMPIRTLASTASDRDEFLYALKRAVYRSDTVIVVGGLEGGIFAPALIGAAVGNPSEKVDYKALGLAEPAKPLSFPKFSIPLVTPDNRIGGMLLEKGGESIIVLSEDANVRHQLLDTLIYPYIFDMEAEKETIADSGVTYATAFEQDDDGFCSIDVAEELISEGVKPDNAVDAEEKTAINPLPNVSDGMFVMAVADDEAEEIAPEDFVPLKYETVDFTGYQPKDEEEEEAEEDDDEYYGPVIPVGKILGVIFALLCIGASAAMFTLFFMGLI